MRAENQNIIPADQPLRVPCPPPDARIPPRAYMQPPKTLTGVSKPIPWPPAGARFPGDRVTWSPMKFSEPSNKREVSFAMLDPKTAAEFVPVILASDLVDDISESVHEAESVAEIIDKPL